MCILNWVWMLVWVWVCLWVCKQTSKQSPFSVVRVYVRARVLTYTHTHTHTHTSTHTHTHLFIPLLTPHFLSPLSSLLTPLFSLLSSLSNRVNLFNFCIISWSRVNFLSKMPSKNKGKKSWHANGNSRSNFLSGVFPLLPPHPSLLSPLSSLPPSPLLSLLSLIVSTFSTFGSSLGRVSTFYPKCQVKIKVKKVDTPMEIRDPTFLAVCSRSSLLTPLSSLSLLSHLSSPLSHLSSLLTPLACYRVK